MRIAIVTSATAGGAGIAAARMAQALQLHGGHDVCIFDAETVGTVDKQMSPQRSLSNGRLSNTHFTADHGTAVREWLVRELASFDVVNVHWSSYILSVADLERLAAGGTPILLTLHDFNHVTGGCHYPAGCTGFLSACEGCPQVRVDGFSRQAVRLVKRRKNALLRWPHVHIAAPSRYVLDAAGDASGVPDDRRHHVRNPYAPMARGPAAEAAQDGPRPFTVLLVADSLSERRKGAQLAAESLYRHGMAAAAGGRPLHVHVAGAADDSLIEALRGTGARLHVHGRVTDHRRLVHIYQACDVQICASHEDNWPNVLVEAAAYGCLAVVGPGHGSEEFCRHFEAGAVAANYTPEAFADALGTLAATDAASLAARREALSQAVRDAHAPAAVATLAGRALAQVVASLQDRPRPAPPSRQASCVVSSNYVGAHSRELLTDRRLNAEPPGGPEEIVLSRMRAATSSGLLTIHAVYGHKSPQVVQRRLDVVPVRLPTVLNGQPLVHAFADEANDYGVSVIACGIVGEAPR